MASMDVCDGMGHSVAAAAKLKQQTQAVQKCVPYRGQTQDRFSFLLDVKNVFVSLLRE